MASVDLSALDTSLLHRKAAAQKLLVKKLTAGWSKLNTFRKLRVLDRIVLGSLVTKSIAQPGAKGAFNPKDDVLKVEARIAQVRPAKIDFLVTEQKRLELEATYFAEIEKTDGRDPSKFWLADHIWEHLIENAGIDTLKAVWIGDLNPAGTNAVDICDGIVTLKDADIVSGATPEALILAHSETDFTIEEDNILSEVRKLVKLFREKLPAYGYGPATLYWSPENQSRYEFALETYFKNSNHLIYNQFGQALLYFAKNIKLEPVLDLAGTDFMMIEPDDNMVYLTDRKSDKTELDSDYSKRDRSIALVSDWWFAPNYVRSDIGVINDLRERPDAAPVVDPEEEEEDENP